MDGKTVIKEKVFLRLVLKVDVYPVIPLQNEWLIFSCPLPLKVYLVHHEIFSFLFIKIRNSFSPVLYVK